MTLYILINRNQSLFFFFFMYSTIWWVSYFSNNIIIPLESLNNLKKARQPTFSWCKVQNNIQFRREPHYSRLTLLIWLYRDREAVRNSVFSPESWCRPPAVVHRSISIEIIVPDHFVYASIKLIFSRFY